MDIEKWNIDTLMDACSNKPSMKKKIEIPRIQRRREWKPYQENELIETLKMNKISIGVLQVYKINSDNKKEIYLLADGLHRTTTLVKYHKNPFVFDRTKKIINNITNKFIKEYKEYDKEELKKICDKWFTYDKLGSYPTFVADKTYEDEHDDLINLVNKVADKKDNKKMLTFLLEQTDDLCEEINISESIIPVILNVDINTMPILFSRINKNGTPLRSTDILAADWYSTNKIKIENTDIIECIDKYYEELRKENNDMDVYIGDVKYKNEDERLFTLYEYVIGLNKYLFEQHDGTFLRGIHDKDFIFKLLSCCFFGDIYKKSIEKIKDHLIKQDLLEIEERLNWSISFVARSIDLIILCEEKDEKFTLLIKDIPLYLTMIGTAYKNREQILKNEIYYMDNMKMHLLDDGLSEIKINSLILKSYIEEKKYISKLNKNEFEDKLARYMDRTKNVTHKKDKILNITKLLLMLMREIKYGNNNNIQLGYIIPKKILIDFNNENKSYIPLNTLGNLCFHDTCDEKRKPSQSLVLYLTENNGMNADSIYDNILLIKDNNVQFDDLIYRGDITKKIYTKFIEYRHDRIKTIVLNRFQKILELYHSDESESDESNSDESDSDTSYDSDNASNSEEESDDSDDKIEIIKINNSSKNNNSLKNNKNKLKIR